MTAVEIHAANRLRSWAMDLFERELFGRLGLDAVVSPTTPIVAPPLSAAAAARGESDTALTVKLIKFVFLASARARPVLYFLSRGRDVASPRRPPRPTEPLRARRVARAPRGPAADGALVARVRAPRPRQINAGGRRAAAARLRERVRRAPRAVTAYMEAARGAVGLAQERRRR